MLVSTSTDPQEVVAAICRMEGRALTTEAVLASCSKVVQEYFDLDLYVPSIGDFMRDCRAAMASSEVDR